MALLDSRRRCLLLSVRGQGHTVQGWALRAVCGDSGHGILEVEGACEKGAGIENLEHLETLEHLECLEFIEYLKRL